MSAKADKWFSSYAPLALSVVAVIASGGVAFGATQKTADTNEMRLEAVLTKIEDVEQTLQHRMNRADERMDRILEILIEDRRVAFNQDSATSEPPSDKTEKE